MTGKSRLLRCLHDLDLLKFCMMVDSSFFQPDLPVFSFFTEINNDNISINSNMNRERQTHRHIYLVKLRPNSVWC